MLDILWITAPVYLLIALGALSARTGYVPADGIPALSRFALRVCMPALLFTAIAMPRREGAFEWALMLGYLAASLATLAAGVAIMRVLFRQSPPRAWILGLGMAGSNSGFMGFPIVSVIADADRAAEFLAMVVIIENIAVIPFALVMAEASGRTTADLGGAVRTTLSGVVRNPMLVAVAVAVVVRLTGIPVPAPVASALTMIAAVAPAVALFVVGGTVAQFPVAGHWRRAGAIAAGKLLLHPLFVLVTLMLVPGVPDEMVPIAILFAAVPMMSIFPILGGPFGIAGICAAALVASTAVSFITVSVAAALLLP